MGVKTITKHLNERRIFTRDGGRWDIGTVYRMLTRPTYAGRHEFNKRGKTKELKPADEEIAVDVPRSSIRRRSTRCRRICTSWAVRPF